MMSTHPLYTLVRCCCYLRCHHDSITMFDAFLCLTHWADGHETFRKTSPRSPLSNGANRISIRSSVQSPVTKQNGRKQPNRPLFRSFFGSHDPSSVPMPLKIHRQMHLTIPYPVMCRLPHLDHVSILTLGLSRFFAFHPPPSPVSQSRG